MLSLKILYYSDNEFIYIYIYIDKGKLVKRKCWAGEWETKACGVVFFWEEQLMWKIIFTDNY